jgi:hypothetical protein
LVIRRVVAYSQIGWSRHGPVRTGNDFLRIDVAPFISANKGDDAKKRQQAHKANSIVDQVDRTPLQIKCDQRSRWSEGGRVGSSAQSVDRHIY